MKPTDETLIAALRGGGHDDVADALDRKARAAARATEEPDQRPAPRTKEEADEAFLGELKSAIADPWSPSPTPLFGGPDA